MEKEGKKCVKFLMDCQCHQCNPPLPSETIKAYIHEKFSAIHQKEPAKEGEGGWEEDVYHWLMFWKKGGGISASIEAPLKKLIRGIIISEIRLAEERLVERILDKKNTVTLYNFEDDRIEAVTVESIVSTAKGFWV